MKMFRSRKGFTLIEISVVMCLLIVLMGVLLPKASGAQTQAKLFVDKQSIAAINDCIALHCAANGFSDLCGQTSMSVTSPIKNGDSVTVIMQYLKDKGGMLDQSATIFYTTGHVYNAQDNKIN